MDIFLQLLINSVIAGAIYSLVASGFSLIYSTNKFIHLAHGSVVAVAAYIAFLFSSLWGLNFWLSIILTIIFSGTLGWLINKTIYQTLRKKKANNAILLIASMALLILLESLILLLFGADIKILGYIKIAKGFEILGAIITPLQIIIIITAIVIFCSLFFLMKKTKIGKAIRAVADNNDLAEIIGISKEKIYSYTFVIGSAMAGMAGILIGLEQNLQPTMGTSLMIKGLTGAIIGGVTSVPGAILGSGLLGLAENFGIWFLPSGYKDAIAFVILFIFLLIRPQGILGKKIRAN